MSENVKYIPAKESIEKQLVACISGNSEHIRPISEIIRSDMFYNTSYAQIFEALIDIKTKGITPDIFIIEKWFKEKGRLQAIGGRSFLVDIIGNWASAANVQRYAYIIRELWMRRELIKATLNTHQRAYEETNDIFDEITSLGKSLSSISNLSDLKQKPTMTQLKDQLNILMKTREVEKKEIVGLQTGYTDWDRIIGGAQPNTLNVIAARPGMGKTSILKGIITQIGITQQKKCLVFSLEMSAMQLLQGFVSVLSGISVQQLKAGQLNAVEWIKYHEAMTLINDNIYIEDTPAITLNQIKNKIARFTDTHGGIDLIGLDYLQLMGSSNKSKNTTQEQIVSDNSAGMKALAKEYDIPIFELSQLSRELESRKTPRPQLSDLRSSGAIEQDADTVTLAWRPDQYGIKSDSDNNDLTGITELIVAKNREGELKSAYLKFYGPCMRFDNLEVASNRNEAIQTDLVF